MKNFNISINKNCPCSQIECPLRGNCVLCVKSHRDHHNRLPECLHEIVENEIKNLTKKFDRITPSKPVSHIWKNRENKKEIVEDLINQFKNI